MKALFKKKNNAPQSVENTPEGEQQKFRKDIKILWIYTTLFCLFALVLIIVSSAIQGKINSTADYYQDLYEGEKTSSQSTIKNIQTENASLKQANENYKAENERLTAEIEQSTQTINDGAALTENAEYLLLAQQELYSGSRNKAKELVKLVDKSILTKDMLEIYTRLCKTLGI